MTTRTTIGNPIHAEILQLPPAERYLAAVRQALRARRIDAGEECPKCGGKDVRREQAWGCDLFVCNDSACRCAWFDLTDDGDHDLDLEYRVCRAEYLEDR